MRAVFLALSLFGGAALAEEEFLSLKGHGGPIMALAVEPGGAGRLASASFDNAAAFWAGGGPDGWIVTTRRSQPWPLVLQVIFLRLGMISRSGAGAGQRPLNWAAIRARSVPWRSRLVGEPSLRPAGTELLESGRWRLGSRR